MPNIITHTLFADDVMDLSGLETFNARKRLFEIGGSGPDILFFHKVNPKTMFSHSPLRQIGSRVHKEKINAFYASFLESIRKEKNPEIKDDMIAYACGHLCHWALDSSCHPYIFYRTGNCKGSSSWQHHRFESLLDAIMLKMKRNTSIAEYDVASEVCAASLKDKRAIARLYTPAIQELFDAQVEAHDIAQTLDDWQTMQKIFRDPKGKKIRNTRKIEKVFGIQNLMSGYCVPPVAEDNYDICNLLHNTWKNPATLVPSTASVLDLYEEALEKAVRAITLFLQAITDPEAEIELMNFIDNRSYDMGTSVPMEMKEFDPVDLSF